MHTEEISYHIEQFRSGDEENALHGLIELPKNAVPEVIDRFRAEALAPIRGLLVKALWERRDLSLIPFLAEALQDQDEEVWQEALDGLVALASPEALNVLTTARTNHSNRADSERRFQLWIDEAIEQVKFELRR